jgi:hypothetical protein
MTSETIHPNHQTRFFSAFACGTIGDHPRYDRKESAMERQGDEVHLNETEATAGVKAQGVRYVLGFSLLLVVIAMSAIWILGSVL